ncbi:SDR family NAD(P)-dependent oxidoreductase [Candidatus Uabimicrobium sp. HlEnr_7]|uniref:SDR family NAD(P)-dependent oxidoreductase n=1 Tax=Candidatus Uabimicrobium helgolandensis TaxID=3095367 RepID=UPI0035592EB0
MELLQDKVALVTGASSGIGREIAKDLVAKGCKVVACARRYERLQKLREEVSAPERMDIIKVDMREEQEIHDMFSQIKEKWGGVDILINNAGISHRSALIDGDTKLWSEMLNVNVLALCICTREAIQQMQEKEVDGHVLHVSSMAAHRVPPGGGIYAATKHAVKALTESLRKELRVAGSNIRITSISPALVKTALMSDYLKDKEASNLFSKTKVLDSKDVVSAIIYALTQPPHVQVHDILLRSVHQIT